MKKIYTILSIFSLIIISCNFTRTKTEPENIVSYFLTDIMRSDFDNAMEYCYDNDSKLIIQQIIDLYKVNPSSFNSDIEFKRSSKINSLENGELLTIKAFYGSSKNNSYRLKLRKRNGEWKVIITDSFIDFIRGVDRSGKDLSDYESTVLPGDLGENNTNSSAENADDDKAIASEMSSEVPKKYIGKWKAWDGTEKIFLTCSFQGLIKAEQFGEKIGNPIFRIQISNNGNSFEFLYDSERDVLKPRQLTGCRECGEITIDDDSEDLLFFNLNWKKID